MQGTEQKHRIVREAARLLQPGGRYGIHELCLAPDNLDGQIKREIEQALSRTIHVGARPLTASEWRAVLEAEGFSVRAEVQRPMRLLEPDRLIQDEGFWGALRFVKNLLRDKHARQRGLAMRRIFVKHRSNMAAIVLPAGQACHADASRARDSNQADAVPSQQWAYHLGPVLKGLDLRYYEDMKLAKLDGWDLKNERGEPWPLPDLKLSAENVGRSHLRAYVRAKEILLRRASWRCNRKCVGATMFNSKSPELAKPRPPAFKSWLEYTAGKN